MSHQLTSTQAFWLGHLHHAFSLGQSLSRYAHEQGLSFADLMVWRQRLMIQKIVVPDMHRPNRFGPSTEKYNIPQEGLFFDEA